MTGSLRKLLSRRLREVPLALALVAVAMQVGVPLLHSTHEDRAPIVAADAGPAGIHATGCHEAPGSRPHAAPCSQCRAVSQLKTVSPFVALASQPVLRADWIAGATCVAAGSRSVRDTAAPRAPPVLA